MPMLPAKAVNMVLAFFVSRLFVESASAVKKLMEVFFLPGSTCGCSSRPESYGILSPTIRPSFMRIMRLA